MRGGTEVSFGHGGVIQFGDEQIAGVTDLSISGVMEHMADRPAPDTALHGTMQALAASVRDYPIGPRRLSAGRIHIESVNEVSLGFTGFRPGRLTGTVPEIDISMKAPWPASDWGGLAARAARATGAVAPELAHDRLTTSLLFTSDSEIQALNREWRDKDRPTNVLSFPMLSREEMVALEANGPPVMLGDIALAHETCAAEASEKNIPLIDHAAHLIVHGLLHLAGYDHETSPEDAEAMEEMEIKALALMGIANPYSPPN